jgi:hypothetical protein
MGSTVLRVACGPGATVTLKPLLRLQVQAHGPIDRPAAAPALLSESEEVTGDDDDDDDDRFSLTMH